MEKLFRKIKNHYGFDAASKVSIKNLASPRRLANIYRYVRNKNSYPVTVPYYPMTLMVEVSTICNLKCPGCERELYREDNTQGGLPVKNVSLSNLTKLGPVLPYVYSTYFVGGLGEPFLNKEFWDIHRYFKGFGIKTGYFSNASIVTDDHVALTFLEKVDSVLISIDSHIKEKYESIKSGSKFDRVVSNVRKFYEYKRRHKADWFQLGLNFIFRSDNFEDIMDYLDFAKHAGADFIHCSSFITHLDGQRDNSFFNVDSGVKRRLFENVRKKAGSLGIDIRLPKIEPDAGCFCNSLWHGVCIFYNGDVCACPYFRSEREFYYHASGNGKIVYGKRHYKDTVLGNYLSQDFLKDIWNGEKSKNLRLSELNKGELVNPCSTCYYKYDLH